MRSLYDIIYDETFNRYLRWKLRQHTKLRLTIDEFIDYMVYEVEWLLESMWIMVRINHSVPNEHIDEFKKTFNEALIILNNTELCRSNTYENRKKVLYRWADAVDLLTDKRLGVFAERRVREEGVDTASELYQKTVNEFVDEFDDVVEAILNVDLEYINRL